MKSKVVYGAIIVVSVIALTHYQYASLNSLTPDQSIRNLVEAAQKSDVEGFLSGLTADSRRAVEESHSGEILILQKQEEFRKALDRQFGEGSDFISDPPDTLAATVKRLVSAEIVSQKQKPDGSAEVQVKSVFATESTETASFENTLVVRKEGGEWKLWLGFPAAGRDAAKTAAVVERLTKEVNEGKYKDRGSAMLELDKALMTKEVQVQ